MRWLIWNDQSEIGQHDWYRAFSTIHSSKGHMFLPMLPLFTCPIIKFRSILIRFRAPVGQNKIHVLIISANNNNSSFGSDTLSPRYQHFVRPPAMSRWLFRGSVVIMCAVSLHTREEPVGFPQWNNFFNGHVTGNAQNEKMFDTVSWVTFG